MFASPSAFFTAVIAIIVIDYCHIYTYKTAPDDAGGGVCVLLSHA